MTPADLVASVVADLERVYRTGDSSTHYSSELVWVAALIVESREAGQWLGPNLVSESMGVLVSFVGDVQLSTHGLCTLYSMPDSEGPRLIDAWSRARAAYRQAEQAAGEEKRHGPAPKPVWLPPEWQAMGTPALRCLKARIARSISHDPHELVQLDAELKRASTELRKRPSKPIYEKLVGNAAPEKREALREALQRRARCRYYQDAAGLEQAKADIQRIRGKTPRVFHAASKEPPWERYRTVRAAKESLARLKRRAKVAVYRSEAWEHMQPWITRGEARVRELQREEYEARVRDGQRPNMPAWLRQERERERAIDRERREAGIAVQSRGQHRSTREARLLRWVYETPGEVETETHKLWPWAAPFPRSVGPETLKRIASSWGMVDGELWYAFRR